MVVVLVFIAIWAIRLIDLPGGCLELEVDYDGDCELVSLAESLHAVMEAFEN